MTTSPHDWRSVLNGLLEDSFPRVCSRCLLREDNPLAGEPCDALAERIGVPLPPRQPDNRHAVVQFWRLEKDDCVGGWCVVVDRPGTPATGNPPVADFVWEGHARHIVAVHNEWLKQLRAPEGGEHD